MKAKSAFSFGSLTFKAGDTVKGINEEGIEHLSSLGVLEGIEASKAKKETAKPAAKKSSTKK